MTNACPAEKPHQGQKNRNRRARRRKSAASRYRTKEKLRSGPRLASGPHVDYNARIYDPTLGRFLSVDPLIAHPGSTQSINPYSYVENNPLNKTDPTGEDDTMTCTGSGTSLVCTATPLGSHIPQQTTVKVGSNGQVTTSGAGALPGGGIAMSTDGNSRLTFSPAGGQGQGTRGQNPQKTSDHTQINNNAPNSAGGTNVFGHDDGGFWHNFGCGFSGKCSVMDSSWHQGGAYDTGNLVGGFLSDFGKVLQTGAMVLGTQIVGGGPEDPAADAASAAETAAIWGEAAEEEGGLNLFKWEDATSTKVTGWKEGDRFLNLPNQGSPRANWIQNASRLRDEMNKGNPIFDSYRDPYTGEQIPAGQTPTSSGRFLRAERELLENHGWQYDSETGAYHPPP